MIGIQWPNRTSMRLMISTNHPKIYGSDQNELERFYLLISTVDHRSDSARLFFYVRKELGGGVDHNGGALHRFAVNPATRCSDLMDDGCYTLDMTRRSSWKVAHLGLGQQGPYIRDTMAFIPHQQLRRRILVPRLPQSASKRCSCIPRIQATRLTRKLNFGRQRRRITTVATSFFIPLLSTAAHGGGVNGRVDTSEGCTWIWGPFPPFYGHGARCRA